MKKSIILFAIIALAWSCTKFDSGVTIYTNPNLPRCLSPVSVQTNVKYDNVTVELKVFSDAKLYEMEMYSEDVKGVEDPDPEKLVTVQSFLPIMVPYEFKAPEEMKLYYRMRATNTEKDPSLWVYGSFETGTDPSTICTKPVDATAKAVFDKVTFSWTTFADTEIYELEVYKSPIPESGEPAGSDLVKSYKLAPSDIPYTEKFEQNKNFYFRVRATAPSSTRRNSKWATGSFATKAFVWPNEEAALDYGLTAPWTATINSTKFPGYSSGTKVPAEHIVVDKVTYGYDGTYYGDRYQIAQCYDWDKTSYAVSIPKKRFEMFKINKPGTLSFVPYASKTPSIVIALIVTKAGEKSASYAYKKENVTCYNKSGDKETYRQSFEITEDMLYGIEEAATIYIFSDANGGFNCYPITWAPAQVK